MLTVAPGGAPSLRELAVPCQEALRKSGSARVHTPKRGKTYYFITHDVATSPEAGSMANFTLEPADPDEAKMLIEGYPQVKATAKK